MISKSCCMHWGGPESVEMHFVCNFFLQYVSEIAYGSFSSSPFTTPISFYKLKIANKYIIIDFKMANKNEIKYRKTYNIMTTTCTKTCTVPSGGWWS